MTHYAIPEKLISIIRSTYNGMTCRFLHAVTCRVLHAVTCRVVHAVTCWVLHAGNTTDKSGEKTYVLHRLHTVTSSLTGGYCLDHDNSYRREAKR